MAAGTLSPKETTITRYTYSFISELASRISDILDPETLDTLKEIKERNVFIRRRPLRLQYRLNTSLVDEWRKEKKGEIEVSPLIRFMNSFTGFLNKISDKNLVKILDDIYVLTENYCLDHTIDKEFYDAVIDRLFESATTEENYIGLYGDVSVKVFIKIFGDAFKTELIEKVSKYLTENLQKESMNLSSKMDYDKLCEAIAEKSSFVGAYVFVGSLYHLDVIDLELVQTYLNDLMYSLMNSDGDTVEKYIDCIDSFLRICGEKLQENMEDFNDTYRDVLDTLSKDTKKLKFKFRFKLQELVSYIKNDWSNGEDDDWTTVIKKKP